MKKNLHKLGRLIKAHKIVSSVVIIIIVVAGYYIIKKIVTPTPTPQYILGTVHKGTIAKTVTGSAQVSSENQLDITSEVSAKILSINKSVGDHVQAGDTIVTLDSSDARIDLENSKIAYAKLVEPAKAGDITNAENNLDKAYSDGLAAISSAFLHFPTVMSGLKDMLYGRTGYLSDQQAGTFSETARNYRFTAATTYENTNSDYATLLVDYKSLTKTSSRTTIENTISKTSDLEKKLAETLKEAQTAYTFISTSQPEYNPSGATAAASSLSTWSGEVSSDLSGLLSAKNSIDSDGDTLSKLREGADALDIQSEQLAVDQKQKTYSKYFIRAPFEGVIGRIPVHVYDQANSGTVIATISSSKKVTTIPLNEVDAVKVAKGQKAVLTFDAIEGLKIDGAVVEVDLVGTASQGVVTYNVKIAFDDTDARIRPGMSVDASIVTESKDDVLVVPGGAVKTQGVGRAQTSYVEILDANGTPQKQTVTVGTSDDTNTEIVSGITEGQKIVVRTVAGTGTKTTAPTILSGLGGGQQNVIRNANRTAR